jgi:ABC-type sugar transport system permease subunit
MFEPLLPVAAHFMTSLLGYGPLLLQGIWLTLKLALLSLLLGLVFGLIGACAKLSRVWGWRFSAQLYTTLIPRGAGFTADAADFLWSTNRAESPDKTPWNGPT